MMQNYPLIFSAVFSSAIILFSTMDFETISFGIKEFIRFRSSRRSYK